MIVHKLAATTPIAFVMVLLQAAAPALAGEPVDYTKLGIVGVLAIAVVALWQSKQKSDSTIREYLQTNTASMTKAIVEQTAATKLLTDTLNSHLSVVVRMHEENRDRLDGIKEMLHDQQNHTH